MLRAGAEHPDAGQSEPAQLFATLHEYLQLEHKFQPRLCLPTESEHGEVTSGARDGAAHVLRCLKVWYDLPAEVLIHAINLFDRFLTKMKVRPCHLPCITVSCMNIAIEQYAAENNEPRRVSLEDLVSVSQSACTVRDAARMAGVVRDKLALAAARAHSPLHWLRALRLLLLAAARDLRLPRLPQPLVAPESEVVNLLEIVLCDSACVNSRAPELALVLIYHKLECQLMSWPGVVPEDAYRLFDFGGELQRFCNISSAALLQTRALVAAELARYSARAAAPRRQRLVWRLSERTLKVLRPTDRLTSLLPTIQEQHLSTPASGSNNINRPRSGSESSENEETSDWPRSPVLPVYCNN